MSGKGQHAFLAALCGLVETHRPHLGDTEVLALVMAWCAAQGDTMTDAEIDRVTEDAYGLAVRMEAVPERVN